MKCGRAVDLYLDDMKAEGRLNSRNSLLAWVTPEWLEAAADYLRKAREAA